MQDIEIGDCDFDEAFIIKSNDEGKVRRLFQMAQLRKMVDSQTQIYLTVKEDEGWFGADFPEGVDDLYFQVAECDSRCCPSQVTLPTIRSDASFFVLYWISL